jgi:hypothetical protein
MYTNIDTEPALESISKYLREEQGNYNHYNAVTLIEALEIVFRNNFFKFSDTYWHQISGTAMGTPPAPPWATCTYGLHEQVMISCWQEQVSFYKRFIDDVIGIWLVHSLLEFTTKPLSRLSGLVVNSNKTSTQEVDHIVVL